MPDNKQNKIIRTTWKSGPNSTTLVIPKSIAKAYGIDFPSHVILEPTSDGIKPLVQDQDIVLFGYRDAQESKRYGSQDVRASNINVFDLSEVRNIGIVQAATKALNKLSNELSGIWIHLDVDVLDDVIMPAVDYRILGGLNFAELSDLLKVLFESGQIVGMDITIFNPNLDKDGSIARRLVSSITDGMF